MFRVPPAVYTQFESCLCSQTVPQQARAAYHRWLRYYLDFCHKYHFESEQHDSLPHFLKKLQEKKQTEAQQAQAAHAISLYYDLIRVDDVHADHDDQHDEIRPDETSSAQEETPDSDTRQAESSEESDTNSRPDEETQQNGNSKHTRPLTGASWKAEYDRLARILLKREYPQKTARVYTKWIRKFQAFTRSKPPEMLSSEDVRAFWAWLPEKRRMTVSTLHQVYDALLLFFRHVLERELEVERIKDSCDENPAHNLC